MMLVLEISMDEWVNPSNAEATFIQSTKTQRFWNPSKPCHVGIHWIAVTEYSQMSTHVPGFQSFFRYFASLCVLANSAPSSIRVKESSPHWKYSVKPAGQYFMSGHFLASFLSPWFTSPLPHHSHNNTGPALLNIDWLPGYRVYPSWK